MIPLLVCRNTITRFLVALVIISSLVIPPCGYAQDAEDSQIFIAGFNAYQQKDYAGTIEKMNEVLQKYPDSPLRDMVLFWLSRAYYKSGNQQEAARNLSQFSKEYPDNPLKSTVEDELVQLTERFDKGEKLPVGTPPVKSPAIQKEKLAQQRKAEEARMAAEKKAAESKLASEKAEAERLAQAKAEQGRIAAAKAEEARLAAEKVTAAEATRLAAIKAEEDRKAVEKAETARLAQAKAEQERIAVAKAEEARLAAEKAASEKVAAEKATAKLAADKAIADKALAAETTRLAAIKAEEDRKGAERQESERLAQAKAEKERLAVLKAEEARMAIAKTEEEKLAAVKATKEREAQAKLEAERAAKAKAEELRIASEKAENEKIAAMQAAAEKSAADKIVAEQAELVRMAQAKAEQAKLAAEKEATQAAAAKVAAEKATAEKAEQDRVAAVKAEQDRIAAAKAEAEITRLAALKAEEERLAEAEKKELERLAKAEMEATEKVEAAKNEHERIAAANAEQTRLAAAQAEKERQQQLAAEQKRMAAAKVEEKAVAAKKIMREKAIAQFKSVIETYPGSNAANAAATKLKELGVAIALPTAKAAAEPEILPENTQVLKLEVAQFAGFEFNLLAEPQAYEVARLIPIPFEVINRGNGNDTFTLESGFPPEFKAWFSASSNPDKAITETTILAPGESFKGNVNVMVPASSIDGRRFTHPVKTTSRYMLEATQSREVKLTAAAPLLRAIVKTAATSPLPGAKVSYKVTILNVGSIAANDVTFRLDYPPQLEASDAISNGFKPEGKGVLSLSGVTVNSGESKEFLLDFILKKDSLAGQELLTRGEIRNNRLETTAAFISNAVIVQAERGVQVRSAANRQTIIPGQTVTVPFVVTNTGNVREKFRMTSNVTAVTEAIVFNDLNRDGIRQASEPVITEVGPLAPREEANIVIEIKTPRTAADRSEGNARITFTSEGDLNKTFVGDTRLVYSRPVLQMAMAGKGGQLKPGDVASFDLTITNTGSNLARVVELSSYWPEQLDLVAADPTNTSVQNGTVLWKFKEVGAGEKRTIKVSFKVKPGTGVGTAIQVRNSFKYEDQLGNRY